MQSALPDGTYPTWRWDQVRLEYLRVEHVPRLSAALCNVSGLDVSDDDLQIRKQFFEETGLHFKPASYTLWRNYGRVFKLLLLAQAVDERVQATSLAKAAGGKQLDSDRYLEHIFALARFPHPAFQDYQPAIRPARPFVAVFRLLLLNGEFKRGASAEDVCSRLIANQCRGDEPDGFYSSLVPGAPSTAKTVRQVRELLRFASQHSALTWLRSRLVPATRGGLQLLLSRIQKLSAPGMRVGTDAEITALAQLASGARSLDPWAPRDSSQVTDVNSSGIRFLEGNRRFVQHFRLERNRRLRKFVIGRAAAAAGHEKLDCNCCGLVPRSRYSWSDASLLDVHHLLPLSSSARPNATGTDFSRVKLVCPTCHRAIHERYRIYLDERKADDFASEAEAVELYNEVRSDILGSGSESRP